MTTFDAIDKLNEVRREIAMRERVYGPAPTPQQCKQLAIMRAIAADYDKSRITSDLFGARLAASTVLAEIMGLLGCAWCGEQQKQRAADRIAKAIQEGK